MNPACEHPDCERSAVARLGANRYCRIHFVEICYERMDAYRQWYSGRSLAAVDPADVRAFIADCTRELTDLATTSQDLENLERARLLDLLLSAAELGRLLRRGSRRSVAFPVRLIFEGPEPWEEDAETRVVSRFGANLLCHHPLQQEDVLLVVRRDNQRRATARVAWVRPLPDGSCELGIELLNADNLWELDWDASDAGPARPRRPVGHPPGPSV